MKHFFLTTALLVLSFAQKPTDTTTTTNGASTVQTTVTTIAATVATTKTTTTVAQTKPVAPLTTTTTTTFNPNSQTPTTTVSTAPITTTLIPKSPVTYPKQVIYNWIAFSSNLPGNTPGWILNGQFNVITATATSDSMFNVTLQLWPSSTDIAITNNVYQTYIQFANWDTTLDESSFNNLGASNQIIVSQGAVSSTSSQQVSCGLTLLQTLTQGGYQMLYGSNPSNCINAWTPASCQFTSAPGKSYSTCWSYRWFTFYGAYNIQMGTQVSFIAGFNKWSDNTGTATLQAQGVSPTLNWTITDSAATLITTAATLALVTLSL